MFFVRSNQLLQTPSSNFLSVESIPYCQYFHHLNDNKCKKWNFRVINLLVSFNSVNFLFFDVFHSAKNKLVDPPSQF